MNTTFGLKPFINKSNVTKRIFLFLVTISILIFSGCSSENSKNKKDSSSSVATATQAQTTTTIVEKDEGILPYMFYYNGILCNVSETYETFYDGALRTFDYSLIDDYKMLGVTYDKINGTPEFDFQTNFVKDGIPVFYNEETNKILLWFQDGRSWLIIRQFTFEEAMTYEEWMELEENK